MTIMSRDFTRNDLEGDPVRASALVKKQALAFGADVVGIGSIDRWEGAPIQMDPRQIMPECRSIIGLAFRVNRGSLRGIEEGTYFSKMFLTPQFGPRNRVGVILTDLELAPDPLYDGPPLCNRCMACVKACPGRCFDTDRRVKVTLAGREVEWIDLDMAACSLAFTGAKASGEPVPEERRYSRENTVPGEWSPFHRKPRNLYNTGQAVCGARGCTRACMIRMEHRGVLENRFREKFRRRTPWTVDWSTPAAYPEGAEFRPTVAEPD